MARAPDARYEQAYELFKRGKKLVEIASQLNLPDSTVRRWKCTHKWDNERSDNKNERSERKRGGQPGNHNATGPPGNKNAVGNPGGAAPLGNKNAVKTGEFETIFFDTLEEDEKKLINNLPADKETLLLQEIKLLTVRERRMLERISELKELNFTITKRRKGTEKEKYTDLEEHQATLGQVQSIEDALTRVQARKQRAIDSLHKFGYDDAHLDLEVMKVELAIMKQDSPEEDTPDDGFLDALNASTAQIWGEDNV